MPIIRVKEIRELSPEERAKKLNEFRTELVRLKTMVKAGGAVENPARIKELRKAIARILTIENEQKIEASLSQASKGGRRANESNA
ncbi:50S ribosomal protein L29 [Candidatus Bathyarchaeota archaeon]|nr:50S ribosomal protein L29 [Candidatus Bathyarchaeota archaeon]